MELALKFLFVLWSVCVDHLFANDSLNLMLTRITYFYFCALDFDVILRVQDILRGDNKGVMQSRGTV